MSDPNAHGGFSLSVSADLPVPEVALAIGAHPDDVEFGCGATLAKWAASGCRVHHLVCTDGSKGSWDPSRDRAGLVETRRAEQLDASEALGGGRRVTFLGLMDGELGSGVAERSRVAYEIRRVRPDVVLGHDPWKRYRLHPDHRHAGFLATDAIVAARDPLFFPEHGLAPHRPSRLLLWEADEPDHLEDAGGWLEVKLRALLAHRSQFESTMGITAGRGTPEAEAGVQAFAVRLRERASAAGSPLGLTAAEAFKLISDL